MHQHKCRHCLKLFVCAEDATCFRALITCDECFLRYDVKYAIAVFLLGLVAIGLTMLLFNLMRTN